MNCAHWKWEESTGFKPQKQLLKACSKMNAFDLLKKISKAFVPFLKAFRWRLMVVHELLNAIRKLSSGFNR